MKRIELMRHDRPDRACEVVEVAAPGEPGENDVVASIRCAAINPADLLIFEGRYPGPEALPAPVGIEGAGVVEVVGAGVTGLVPGDHVISLGRANWAQQVAGDAATFIKIPKALDFRLAAQLKANPPSAKLMLSDYEDLEPGDWVIQNAANSAVGRHLIRMAAGRGIKTINVVRRAALIPELEALGADVVVVDGGDLATEVRARAGQDANVRLGIDAIGGQATSRIADCLSVGGTVVNYGFLSGEPCQMTPTHLVVKGLSLTGFWLVGFMRSNQRPAIQALYEEMSRLFMDGTLVAPVEAEYGIDDIEAALAHAHRESRDGKILILPNGPLD
ncbi:MAG: zinc-dependent alcohol dehydrogenase family protein [Pseudomonadota bacterium]